MLLIETSCTILGMVVKARLHSLNNGAVSLSEDSTRKKLLQAMRLKNPMRKCSQKSVARVGALHDRALVRRWILQHTTYGPGQLSFPPDVEQIVPYADQVMCLEGTRGSPPPHTFIFSFHPSRNVVLKY